MLTTTWPRTCSTARYPLGSNHARASESSGDRTGWRGRKTADAVDHGSRKTGGPVRGHVSLDRLRALQSCQRGNAANCGVDAVQVALAGQTHLFDVALLDYARQLRHAGARAAAPRAAVVPGERGRDLSVDEPDW